MSKDQQPLVPVGESACVICEEVKFHRRGCPRIQPDPKTAFQRFEDAYGKAFRGELATGMSPEQLLGRELGIVHAHRFNDEGEMLRQKRAAMTNSS